MSANAQRYNVGGIYLQRPFKIRRLGHFGFNVEKLPEGREFYGEVKVDWTHKPGHGPEGAATHFAYGWATQLVVLDEEGRLSKVVHAPLAAVGSQLSRPSGKQYPPDA